MAALQFQNDSHVKGQPPSYYAFNRLYPDAYVRNDWPTRTSRRIHDGFSLVSNYGLDTTSDDINESPYSSPYYVNGRYNSLNLTTQRGNSSSVQGVEFLTSIGDTKDDFTDNDIQTWIELWQGKQIRFKIPYEGKVVGNTITLQNVGACTGILSIYLSATEDGAPLYETAIDLCKISEDNPEHIELRSIKTIHPKANPVGELYCRMEIWDEISDERSSNPFNTGRKILIAATGLDGHEEAIVKLGNKNIPADGERYEYHHQPSRPLIGLIYNRYTCIPVDRVGDQKTGASVSDSGYRYDIFCIKDESDANLIIYDKAMNKILDNRIPIDSRAEYVQIAQVVDTQRRNWVYFVDSYSPLRRFQIGKWQPSEVKYEGDLVDGNGENPDPVIGASLILFHNNRLYIGGFRADPNLFQCTSIEADGPDYTCFPYRFYVPNNSPYALSINTPTAMVEYQSDTIMIIGKNFYSLFSTNTSIEGDPTGQGGTAGRVGMPTQVSSYMDAVGVQSVGDIVNYKGVIYSFDEREGIRRYTGSVWNVIPNSIQSHFDRVDMTKPRKLWGFANRLYFNYVDKIDGKPKALMWDMTMNYQQYPWFQDVDLPFCDVRYDESEDLIGSHPDQACVMKLYAEDTWRRFDTPMVFERHTKYLSVPGNADDMIVNRVHNKVMANSSRMWYIGIAADKDNLYQSRGLDTWYRMPCWATENEQNTLESPFFEDDIYEEEAIARLSIDNIRIKSSSTQVKIRCKTYRAQASLVSTMLEVTPRQLN